MEEFYKQFVEAAKKHFPEQEFYSWEELTAKDMAVLEHAYTTIMAARDAHGYADRVENAFKNKPVTEDEWEYRWSLGLED